METRQDTDGPEARAAYAEAHERAVTLQHAVHEAARLASAGMGWEAIEAGRIARAANEALCDACRELGRFNPGAAKLLIAVAIERLIPTARKLGEAAGRGLPFLPAGAACDFRGTGERRAG